MGNSYVPIQQPQPIQRIDFARLSPNVVQITVNSSEPIDVANISETIGKTVTRSDQRICIKNRREQLKFIFLLSALGTINGVQWTGANVQNAIDAIMQACFGGDGDTLTKFAQVITFPALPTGYAHTHAPFQAGATSNSGLACTYASSDGTVATVNTSTGVITPVGAGTCNITASQAGNLFYNAATPVINPLTLT